MATMNLAGEAIPHLLGWGGGAAAVGLVLGAMAAWPRCETRVDDRLNRRTECHNVFARDVPEHNTDQILLIGALGAAAGGGAVAGLAYLKRRQNQEVGRKPAT